MKATDLMLNDLVMCNNKVCKVCSIEGVMILVSFKDGEKLTIEDNIESITLTPNILEKNGFKQTDKGGGPCIIGEWRWGDKGKRNFTVVTITFYKELNSGVRLLTRMETDCSYESGVNMVHSCDIESVHDLQHALKLCRINKNIIL